MSDDNLVLRDEEGQLVRVNGYAYRWTGTPDLEVGDEVALPPSWVQEARGESIWVGKVTGLGSSYTGYHKRILHKIASRP